MESLSGVKVETVSKEAAECLPQIVGCLNTTHSHINASKKLHNPVKVVFTLLQNTLSGYGEYVYEWGVDIFLSLTVLFFEDVLLQFSFDF